MNLHLARPAIASDQAMERLLPAYLHGWRLWGARVAMSAGGESFSAPARMASGEVQPSQTFRTPLRHYENNGLSDYIAAAKYARELPWLGRRETFAETAERAAAMHREHFRAQLALKVRGDLTTTPADPADWRLLSDELIDTTLGELIAHAFEAVTAKRVLPAMRSLQFGGTAISQNEARMFNCAFSPADRVEFFREYFFLLLSGVGCGFSVQRHHVDRLPILPTRAAEHELLVRDFRIADSIEGWADALHALFRAHLDGVAVRFDFSAIRPPGEPLHTAGGFAPGAEPLRRALADATRILRSAAGRRLRPIEVCDLCLFVAHAVSDGSRRSASICLFSPDDREMMTAKTGNWMTENPQRALGNNSAVLSRAGADEALFRQLFEAQKEFGEPGFYFADRPDYGCNPCGEAGLHPVFSEIDDENEFTCLRAAGYKGVLSPDTRLSGWAMCNLTTINGTVARNPDEFFLACIYAAAIGTLQAAYTNIPYLGPVTRAINERDALLGVSICGFMDNPGLLFAPRILERGARLCRAANHIVAAAIGIRPAARVTCVKPEGTASLLLDAAPGIHPRPARHYFRRVQADRRDPVYMEFRAVNLPMTEASALQPATGDVIVFPVEAPAHAIVRNEISAVEFLRRVLVVQWHWVLAGEAPAARSPGLHHGVSLTCAVRANEWPAVADFIWHHRTGFAGVTLLGDEAGERYVQPPFQPVATDRDVVRWNELQYQPVNYASARWTRAQPIEADVPLCVPGACED